MEEDEIPGANVGVLDVAFALVAAKLLAELVLVDNDVVVGESFLVGLERVVLEMAVVVFDVKGP